MRPDTVSLTDRSPPQTTPREALLDEIEQLKIRLAEAEETLQAIRNGEVDALVVADKLYIVEGIEAASNRFRGEVMAQIDDAVIAVDNEHRVIYFNAAAERQYATAASDALGHPLGAIYEYRWLHPGDEASAYEALQSTGSWRGRNIHVKKSGEQIHVESTVTVLRDGGGSPSGLLAVVRDVTDRVRADEAYTAQRLAAEQALRDADRRKDEFLATLAHELRNPLAPIRNALQLMQLSPDPAIHENARSIIGRQLQQMVHLVDDLLDVSRISQGKVELRRQRIDVISAVHAAIETSRPLIDAGQHVLEIRLPAPRTLVVDADLTRLCQIIANLLNNAAKYTPRGGRIEIGATRDGPHAVICVQDSGVGISADMLPRVFDMFAQVDRSLEHSQGGLGIGLALVKRLVELHGGSVQAHSDGPGLGSKFCVRIPRGLAEPTDASIQGTPGLLDVGILAQLPQSKG
ncbi:PAS domain-containing sensor histidine kinase [Piscinibacter sp. XHJ-5]|uniref:sensor histidine kinase n=1 Tax=Piscinibacter sp. XHJ-5 TaxID=3037797 RepID=UPI00245309D4|nr:PAS domain-containing sensor histidine kinase [Piscinibacter sp. XHJ-5]